MSVTKFFVSAAFLAAIGGALPASASNTGGFVSQTTASNSANQQILARRGADDGANHDRNDDRGHDRGRDDGANHARNGADDGANHDKGDARGRGRDDGANHG